MRKNLEMIKIFIHNQFLVYALNFEIDKHVIYFLVLAPSTLFRREGVVVETVAARKALS